MGDGIIMEEFFFFYEARGLCVQRERGTGERERPVGSASSQHPSWCQHRPSLRCASRPTPPEPRGRYRVELTTGPNRRTLPRTTHGGTHTPERIGRRTADGPNSPIAARPSRPSALSLTRPPPLMHTHHPATARLPGISRMHTQKCCFFEKVSS